MPRKKAADGSRVTPILFIVVGAPAHYGIAKTFGSLSGTYPFACTRESRSFCGL